MTRHDLGDTYELVVSPVYGDFRVTLRLQGVLVAQRSGLAKSHSQAVRWGVKAKRDHQRSFAIASSPKAQRTWRQKLFG